MMVTSEDVRLWGGLALMALGALTLAGLWLAVVTGIAVRLYHLAAGEAVLRRRVRGRRRVQPANGERVPLSVLLDGGAGSDTAPIEVVSYEEAGDG